VRRSTREERNPVTRNDDDDYNNNNNNNSFTIIIKGAFTDSHVYAYLCEVAPLPKNGTPMMNGI
jgi:hypothetical protein